MNNGSNIRVVGPDNAPEPQTSTAGPVSEEPIELVDEYVEEWEEEIVQPRSTAWILPVLAAVAIAGWTAFYGWAHQAEILSGGTSTQWAAQWSERIIAWSIPVLLIVSLWMLALRNSTREAARYGEVARSLSDESAALEHRLSVINRELSIARDFLGSQSRELESLGRAAGERLSAHADHLQSLIQDNGAQVDAIATVSTTALENMVRLRDDLPVIANSARDVTNNIGNAGRRANNHIEELVAGFVRLNEFGEATQREVASLQVSINASLAEFEAQTTQMDAIARSRFDALRTTNDQFRTELDTSEVEALSALRRRVDALSGELTGTRTELEEQEQAALVSLRARLMSLRDESKVIGQSVRDSGDRAIITWTGQIEDIQARLTEAVERISALDEAALTASRTKLQELAEEAERVDTTMAERSAALHEQIELRRSQMTQDEQEAIESLSARLAGLDEAIAARRAAQMEQSDRMYKHGEAIAGRLSEIERNLQDIIAQGADTEMALGNGAQALAQKLDENRQRIDETTTAITGLTEDTVRLLELIQASANHSRDILPAAIKEASGSIAATEEQVKQIGILLGEASEKGAELSEYVLGAKDNGQEALDRIERFSARITAANSAHLGEIEQLERSLGELAAQSSRLSDTARTELHDSIAFLKQSTGEVIGEIESGTAVNIKEIADRIGEESALAIDTALRSRTDNAVAELEAAVAKASNAGRTAATNLRDQLAKVNELASNLEARVNRARERAEEQIDHDFSRRVALITESLNSNSIDISKALSNEVTDTAWASYLRGDRGIFTRRAVQLLDHTEARDIAEIYAADREFAENVSRYIHDFEAMLRVMLSTRDGHALGVTLLSSDMGKLYVALAQAIERLRT
jgi:O6-methylguanine-DNA--protein-cysteine methyltransferase